MKALNALAEFVQTPELADPPPARFELLKRHVLDTLGARIAGSRTDEGAAAAQVAASMHDDALAMVLAGCAQARCTEIDDIHLTSCTTPGSVIVPTVLALAACGALGSMRAFSAAALAGYEALIRLGFAVDGPRVLHEGVWPTYRAAAFGSAAAASRAYGLTTGQTAGALSTALALGHGTPPASAPAMSSRWMTLAMAAVSGVLAARGARSNLIGTAAAPERLTKGLGRKWMFDEIGVKPYPTARQALAAVEATRALAGANRFDTLELLRVGEIVVAVPEQQRLIVDRPDVPRTRLASLVSAQYQIALALLEPGRLGDVRRTPLFVDDRLKRFMSRILVRRARELDPNYPRTWPARVTIRVGGRSISRLVRYPLGDARNPFGWDDVELKFRSITSLDSGAADRVVADLRTATLDGAVPRLWELR
jgi:2-methylcitrate dehydratase PrpD